MNEKTTTFNVLIYEAHLLDKIKKVMKLLDKYGKYFYIKHYKNVIAPHYHIYYQSNIPTTENDIQIMFTELVATKIFEQEYRGSKERYVEHLLSNGEYKIRDIVSTMSLND